MGIGNSSIRQLSDNEYLRRISSTISISENDPFWNQLFSFSLPTSKYRSDVMLLEEVTQTFCESLFANNQRTGNFTSLIKVFLSRAFELKSSTECGNEIFVWQTCNALCIIQHLCKFLAENMTEDKIIEQFEACSLAERKKELSCGSVFDGTSLRNYLPEFIETLMNIVINVPIVNFTYALHMEALNCILVLLSVQMFVASPSHKGPIYKIFFSTIHATLVNAFIHGLLQNFIEQRPRPENTTDSDGGGSIVFGVASAIANGLWSVLNFRRKQNFPNENMESKVATLGHQSGLLILVLVTHHSAVPDKSSNLYRDGVCTFRHIQGRTKGSASNPSENLPSFHINLSRLYMTLCSTQTHEMGTLLLYSLLHGNPDVKAFILSKTDVDSLVIPILQILYIAPSQASHHIYMALIILLMLTEDDHFNKSVHDIKLSTVSWYTDRLLSDVTLGDVIILVVLRIIQFNMYQMKDRYLHTNCLAALANMSAHFRSINSYASQRIFDLITSLAKRHKQFLQKMSESAMSTDHHCYVEGESSTTIEAERNYPDEIHTLEEVIRMLLEIVNSCLTGGILRYNSNLVYALLQKRDAFEQLRHHSTFEDVLQNIETIINFFTGKLDDLNQQTMSIDEVREIIHSATMQLPSHCLHKFPELKFRYIEEESPEDFFVPYVWSLVFNKSGLFWNPGCVQLFTLE